MTEEHSQPHRRYESAPAPERDSHEVAVATALDAVTTDGWTYLLDAGSATLRAYLRTATRRSTTTPAVRALLAPAAVRVVDDEFLAGTAAAALIEADRLVVRRRQPDAGSADRGESATSRTARSPLIVGPERAVAVVETPGGVTARRLDAGHETRATCAAAWERAPRVAVAYPTRSRLVRTLEAACGSAVAADFGETVALAGQRGDDQFDPVAVAVVVAAKHELANARLVEWAETTGLAAPSTVSERKRRLQRDDGPVRPDYTVRGRTHGLRLAPTVPDDPDPATLLSLAAAWDTPVEDPSDDSPLPTP
ncbi:DUF5821 family protein [Halobaculum sp. MBLA0147]|uniref:transcriptional regulator TbsP domain-containing protein n=1 Tax=Halobaculum sp. MBLA0147 TaxID=3079934 RepID=UPI003523B0CD